MNQKIEYKTKDLGEAGALLCNSAKLIKLERENDFYWFCFSDYKLCEKISQKYWFGELSVNAKSYQDALQRLKDRLFARR